MSANQNNSAIKDRLTISTWWLLGLLILAAIAMAATWLYNRPAGVIFVFGFTVGVAASALGVLFTPETLD